MEVHPIDVTVGLEVPDDAEQRSMTARPRPPGGCHPIYDQPLPTLNLRDCRVKGSRQIGRHHILAANWWYDLYSDGAIARPCPHPAGDATRPLLPQDLTALPVAATQLKLGFLNLGSQPTTSAWNETADTSKCISRGLSNRFYCDPCRDRHTPWRFQRR